jgi:hypothetical protein
MAKPLTGGGVRHFRIADGGGVLNGRTNPDTLGGGVVAGDGSSDWGDADWAKRRAGRTVDILLIISRL